MASWSKTPIPQKVSIAIIGWFVLSIVLFMTYLIANPYIQAESAVLGVMSDDVISEQTMGEAPAKQSMGSAGSSQTMGDAPKKNCSSLGNVKIGINKKTSAKCQKISSKCEGGFLDDNYCPGDDTIKCCVVSPACKAVGGRCESVAKGDTLKKKLKAGKYNSSYLCPGPANIKCYIPFSPKSKASSNPPSNGGSTSAATR